MDEFRTQQIVVVKATGERGSVREVKEGKVFVELGDADGYAEWYDPEDLEHPS